jgi:hypothetical protein
MTASERDALLADVRTYLAFRDKVAAFQSLHFGALCTAACFQSRLSACCTRDGILTFFADHVVNALVSEPRELDELLDALARGGDDGAKCVYLGPDGCRWRLRPLICAMFLCEQASDRVFPRDPVLGSAWEDLSRHALAFRWPDRPVLFDLLEKRFIDRGVDSPLMHLHKSPGLLRLKRRAGLD